MLTGVSLAGKAEGGEARETRGGGEIRVRADLMPFGNFPAHASLVGLVVDITPVQAIDEKCCLDIVGSQNVQNLVRVDIGAIVEGQGEGVRYGALGDDLSHGDGRHSHLVFHQDFLRGITAGGDERDGLVSVQWNRVDGYYACGQGC